MSIPTQASLAALLAAVSLAASAADPLQVSDAQTRLVPPAAENTGVFMLIHNHGNQERKLVRADSPAAKNVELHNVFKEGTLLKMRPVKDIPIPAMGEAVLKPGSYHVMLIGLKKPLSEGEVVPVTLTFDDGETALVEAPVRKIEMPKSDGMDSKGK